MGQMYLQRFEYCDGITKEALDAGWAEAFKAFARSGNWGNVEKGVSHHQTYGTSWGGFAIIEVDDPDEFTAYLAFCNMTYGHVAHVTFEPLFDMDRVAVPMVEAAREQL